MFEHNFWYWLLLGVFNGLSSLIFQLPFHVPIGLATFVDLYFRAFWSLTLFTFGNFVNLYVFGVCFVIALVGEGVRLFLLILKLIRLLKGLIFV